MGLEKLVTIHRPHAGRDRRIAVFYLHGGGLLYGERDDLPRTYIDRFTDGGYTLICADYPLAPESPLPAIVDAVFELWRNAVAEKVLTGEYKGYFLFGRSSGAYLSLLLAREISRRGDKLLPAPLGVLDYYGYHTLADSAFSRPARAYTALPDIPRVQVDRIAKSDGTAVTSGPKSMRYALYVHARQHEGAWLDLLGLAEQGGPSAPEGWSLDGRDVAALPPLFITASSTDEDVPFRLPKTLSRTAPRAVMKPVYNLPHDFDRDTVDPTGAHIYDQAIEWMAEHSRTGSA